jgi:hypothetical protein
VNWCSLLPDAGLGEDANNLLQETYLRTWRPFDGFESRSSVRTWPYRIAINVNASAVTALIDAASFATGNAIRDRDVTSAKFLHAARDPHITFRSTAVAAAEGSWQVHGVLTAGGPAANSISPSKTPCGAPSSCWL